ncbi:MAG TPA: GtrA family protein [Firmicutes bacterium]|nr:GtrA family protein [Bacillota bacterium]
MLSAERLLNVLFSSKAARSMAEGKILSTFKRYLVVGCFSFGLEYTLFFVLYHMGAVGYIFANSTALLVVFWFNYFLNRCWTFNSTQAMYKQLPFYAFSFFFNIALTNMLMFLGAHLMGISPLLSKVATMGLIVCWNFFFYTKVVYRK